MFALWLSTYTLLVCLQQGLSVADKTCGVDGYDVLTLSKGDYWLVQERSQTEKCLRIPYVTEADIDYCEFYYSFCHALPKDVCLTTGAAQPSVCHKVYYKDGGVMEYSLGEFHTEHMYHPNTTSFDGFETTWMGEPVTTAHCEGNTTMIVSFKCDQDSVWEPGKPNVTKYLDIIFNAAWVWVFSKVITEEFSDSPSSTLLAVVSPFPIKINIEWYAHGPRYTIETSFPDRLLFIVQLEYSGACYIPPTVAPGNCQLDPYHIATLSMGYYWTATLPTEACIGGAGTTCLIVFSFCHALPPNISETCNGASVCQLVTTGGESTSYSLGKFKKFTHFQPSEDPQTPGFNVKWNNGSLTQSCMKGIQTEMVFICDKKAKWSDVDQTANLAQTYSDDKRCTYVFEFYYTGACAREGPTVEKKWF